MLRKQINIMRYSIIERVANIIVFSSSSFSDVGFINKTVGIIITTF